jgi:tripartite-type tricarboxylate transporter receptor subunit TctC
MTNATAALLLACSLIAAAPVHSATTKPFPVKPIRFIVGFPPGGGNDALTRLITPKLSDKLGVPVVIDNRPGAGGNLAAQLTATAPADGYTILMISSSHPIQGLLKKNLPYDPIKDFAGMAQLVVYRSLLVVYPGFPAASVKDVIALAKSKPNQLNFISSGNGTGSHLAGELFKTAANVQMTHVPYKGGAQALVDLTAGRVEMMFTPLVPVLSNLKSGRVRGIAVTSTNRSRIFPDLPTIAESGLPGYEFVSWYGVLAPAATPNDVIAKMNSTMNEAMQSSDVIERVHAEDMDIIRSTPKQFDAVRREMVVKWTKVVKETGLVAD